MGRGYYFVSPCFLVDGSLSGVYHTFYVLPVVGANYETDFLNLPVLCLLSTQGEAKAGESGRQSIFSVHLPSAFLSILLLGLLKGFS